ncbi:MAG: T9SS type A sorting domain-containing protein [Flavobacteriales bacterium]|nr:T9SS type A sorting domain-containing protein [Flavobacteriales bacterium]
MDFYYGLGLDSALQRQNDWWRLTQTVGIAENSVDELPIYPNPASDRLHIPSLHSSDRVQFVDALGRVHELLRIDTNAFDVSHLGAGVYMVIASGRTGGLRTARFVKE